MNSKINGSNHSSGQTQREFFYGKDYNKFMPIFQKFSANPASFQLSWNWPVFFVSFWWFLYRKMYILAALCLLTLFIPYVNIAAWLSWPLAANYMYYKHVLNKIKKIKILHGENYKTYLNDIASVNKWVPIAATITFLIPLILFGIICANRFNYYYNQYSNM